MNKHVGSDIDLKMTLLSGQSHAWEMVDGFLVGSFSTGVIIIKQDEPESFYWQTYPEKDDLELIQNYLHLDHDYEKVRNDHLDDLHVQSAFRKYRGLKLLKQPYEDTVFSFLLSQNKNIKAIRRSVKKLKEKNNQIIIIPEINDKVFLFPKKEFFNQVSLEDLSKTEIGYRNKYIKSAAKLLVEDESYSEKILRSMTYVESLDKLKAIFGIGDKVADCILSFSLGHEHITPIDVWGDRLIKQLYKNTRSKTYDQKRRYLSGKFGKNTAVVGQLLFEYIRGYDAEKYN